MRGRYEGAPVEVIVMPVSMRFATRVVGRTVPQALDQVFAKDSLDWQVLVSIDGGQRWALWEKHGDGGHFRFSWHTDEAPSARVFDVSFPAGMELAR